VRIPRYYIDQALECGQIITLPDELHRHAVQVLRGKVDDALILFNGRGGEYHAKFSEVNKRHSSVEITEYDDVDRESPLDVRLVIALIKSDKFDFAIQKAVEMGVTSIQPVTAARTVLNLKAGRLEKKRLHWRGVITSACEQSGRTRVPELLAVQSLNDYLLEDDERLRLTMLPEATSTFAELDIESKPVSLIIGPEGGFHDDEVELMRQQTIRLVKFGPRILRAETAVVAGLSLCQSYWGDI